MDGCGDVSFWERSDSHLALAHLLIVHFSVQRDLQGLVLPQGLV